MSRTFLSFKDLVNKELSEHKFVHSAPVDYKT